MFIELEFINTEDIIRGIHKFHHVEYVKGYAPKYGTIRIYFDGESDSYSTIATYDEYNDFLKMLGGAMQNNSNYFCYFYLPFVRTQLLQSAAVEDKLVQFRNNLSKEDNSMDMF